MLYGGKVDDGKLNPDSVGRCEAALRAAKQYPDSIIVYGVDYSIPGLTETTIAWLNEKGWPAERLIVNPKGHNSLGEAEAVIEVLNQHGAKEIVIATSWYHLPRVWMIFRLLFDGRFSFSVAWATAAPIGSLFREILGIPKSFLTIILQRTRSPKREKTA